MGSHFACSMEPFEGHAGRSQPLVALSLSVSRPYSTQRSEHNDNALAYFGFPVLLQTFLRPCPGICHFLLLNSQNLFEVKRQLCVFKPCIPKEAKIGSWRMRKSLTLFMYKAQSYLNVGIHMCII